MLKRTLQRSITIMLAFAMIAAVLPVLAPITTKAASSDITDVYVMAETTRSIGVAFHFNRNIAQTDAARLAVWLYKADGTLLTFHDFDLDGRYIDFGTTVGDYSHTFKGLSPDIIYKVRISALAPDWSGTSGDIFVKTPVPSSPVINLNMGWRTANSVWLKGDIVGTGTGPGPYEYLAEELKSNALVIIPRTLEPAGNLSPSDPNAAVVFNEPWREPINVFDHYKEYFTLQPGTAYVAQAILTNTYDNTGYSPKLYFTTFAIPQITIDTVTPRSYDAFIYADIAVDAGDAVDSLALYADDNDDELPRVDPARIAGSLVRYDAETGEAVFKLSGLTPDTAYDIQVFTRSGTGETWSSRQTLTTLPEPTHAAVTTKPASSIRSNKAMMNAVISDMGYSYVLEQGFVFSATDINPRRSFSDPEIVEVTVPITSQTAPITISALADGLLPNTTYHFQSFVRNNTGVSYGGVETFITLDAPAVQTLAGTTGLTTSSVTLYGDVTSTGNISPTLRGFVCSETADPMLGETGTIMALDSVTDSATGQFDETLTNLSAGTTYYYKAFIHSLKGTIYGAERSFMTDALETILPSVTTNPIIMMTITDNSAEVSGNFTMPGGTAVTETGFVYSKFPNPVMGDLNTGFILLPDTDGAFVATLSGLSANTTYYVRAYAKNENGYGYGANVSFQTTNTISAVSPSVVKTMTVNDVTTTAVTVTMTVSGSTLGRYILASTTSTAPLFGAPGVSQTAFTIFDANQKTVAGLLPDTTYYLRGYTRIPDPFLGGFAESYGDTVAVTTDSFGLPIVTSAVTPTSDVTADSAMIHYAVDPNGSPVTKTVIVWSSTDQNPTFGAGGTFKIEANVSYSEYTGAVSELSGLNSGTTYYYAVYAYNVEGWSAAPVQSFTTAPAADPVAVISNVTPGATYAAVTAQLTQVGEGNKEAYALRVILGTAENPTIISALDIEIAPSVGTDPFVMYFYGLSPSTQYYVRPCVTTIDDVDYLGEDLAFTTQAHPMASVALYGPENMSASTADFIVSVLETGGNPITERGVVYNTGGMPDTTDDKVISTGAGDAVSQTDIQISGLTEGTKYYARAYATTATGTAYSSQITFTPRTNVTVPSSTYMLSVGYNHNIALRSDGTVWCWGRGTEGQLGNGSFENTATPVQVSGLTDVKYIAAGYDCSFAVKSNGTVWAWGSNANGELGIGGTTNSNVPVEIPGLSNIATVSASYSLVNGTQRACFAFALTKNGTVYAWGANQGKQVENSTTAVVTSPVQVPGLSDILQISAGYSCGLALKTDGTVWVWGYDWTMSGGGNLVRQVTALGSDNVKITASSSLLVLKPNGKVWSFGDNRYGQCGHDIGTSFVEPAVMTEVTDVTDIETGNFLTVLRKTDGSVWSVGYNLSGEFGNGTYFIPPEEPNSTTLTESLIKSLLPSGTDIIQTSIAEATVGHVADDGSVWMNGSNINDKIGNGATGFGDPVITVHTPYMLPTINLLTSSATRYTITFDAHGGIGTTATAQTGTDGKLAALPAPTKAGFTFDGWYTAVSGGVKISTDTVFFDNSTIHAHWVPISSGSGGSGVAGDIDKVEYTITASAGTGGIITPTDTVTVTEGEDITFTVKPGAGYAVDDVTVDGVSVGAVETYVFTAVSEDHLIAASFRKIFGDVQAGDWFYDAVQYMQSAGLMAGTSESTFNPEQHTSRAMIVTILYRMENEPAVTGSGFSDVPGGMWYSNAVIWAANMSIVSGCGNGRFGPEDDVTREQLAVILFNYTKYKGYDVLSAADLTGFRDSPRVSGWAVTEIKWAVGLGLITGKGGQVLDPQGSATRAEVATLLMRFCMKYAEPALPVY